MTLCYDKKMFQTFWFMLMRSAKVSGPALRDKIINNIVWASCNIVVFGFIMSSMGLGNDIAMFITLTMPASAAIFISINCIYGLLYDLTTDGSSLQYELTLPIPQWMTFVKYGIDNMVQSFIVASIVSPVGYLFVYQQYAITLIEVLKYYNMLFAISFFAGFFALLIVSITTDFLHGLDNVWIRVLFPMWFFGCFQFSWNDIYKVSPILAYLDLLNPMTYGLEGSRAATSYFAHNSLHYGYCFVALILFGLLSGYVGIKKLMKRTDCL